MKRTVLSKRKVWQCILLTGRQKNLTNCNPQLNYIKSACFVWFPSKVIFFRFVLTTFTFAEFSLLCVYEFTFFVFINSHPPTDLVFFYGLQMPLRLKVHCLNSLV